MPTMRPDGATMAMALGGMNMAQFSFTTDVTLFFAGWRTDTPAKYFGTLLFTFFLTLFTRFLGAWRSQLGHKWANQAAIARAEDSRRKSKNRRVSKRKHARDAATHRSSLADELKAESEPFSPAVEDSPMPGEYDDELPPTKEEQLLASLGPRWTRLLGSRWKAAHPWKLTLDVPRAFLEGMRALFGYLL